MRGLRGKAAGASHYSPRAQTCAFEGPGFQEHQNSTRRPPRERRKNENCGRREKKVRNFGRSGGGQSTSLSIPNSSKFQIHQKPISSESDFLMWTFSFKNRFHEKPFFITYQTESWSRTKHDWDGKNNTVRVFVKTSLAARISGWPAMLQGEKRGV